MAIKDFRFYMVPRDEVIRLHGALPLELLDYKSNFGSIYLAVDNDETTYWSSNKLTEINELLSKAFVKADVDYPETEVYSGDFGSRVQGFKRTPTII
jgi:hypothetical protein